MTAPAPAAHDLLLVGVQAVVVVVAVALVDVVLAGFFGPDLPGTTYVVLLCAAVAGASCAVPVALRRSRAFLVGGYLVGFLLLAGVVLRPGAWSPSLVGVVAGDVWNGWNRMLSVNLPADPLPELTTLPVLLSWSAAFVAVAVAVRSAGPLVPVVPLVGADLVALLLTAGLRSGHLPATAALAICLGVLVHLRVRHPAFGRSGPAPTVTVTAGTHGRVGRTVRGAVTVGVIAGIVGTVTLGTVGAAAALPARFDPRAVAPPPVAVRPSVTPLTLVTTQLRQPPKPLFRVRLQAGASVDRVRTAVLDRYDGTTWSSSAHFLVAGRVLPAVPQDRHGSPASMTVLLEGWSGPFLPVVGTPTELGGTGVPGERAGYDSGTETLVWSEPAARGATYTVTGLVPRADDALRSAAVAAPGPGDEPPPEVPAALRDVAGSTLGGPGPPLERLRRLEAFLCSRPYSPATPAGHSYAALQQLTTATEAEARGDTEQHAAAFALLARLAGFPTRVAVGYLLPPPDATGVHRVASRDAHAWPEVRFDGYGWIPFEPTDTTHRAPDPAPVPDAVVVPPPPPAAPPPAVPPALTPPHPTRARTFALLAVVTSLALLACAVLALAAVVGAKAVRRAARRRGTATARLHGAWEEMLDVLIDRRFAAAPGHRFAPEPAFTPDETAAASRLAFGAAAEPVGQLADLVTAAAFGDVGVADADAATAWRIVAGVRRGLDAGPGRLRRVVRATVDPRSLGRGLAFRHRARRSLRRLGLEVT